MSFPIPLSETLYVCPRKVMTGSDASKLKIPIVVSLTFFDVLMKGAPRIHSTHFFLKNGSGAGSYPPREKGLQRRIRHMPSNIPTITP